ncbi:WD40 repeat domain-containing serine/threonine protein kinase [Nocardiopsis sp. NPDC050513]|uniref:WD40 repeat domain-containing serine/threonine protein kinase n=1 Tax=Nocardiopsis sp. NPDC050513 TaxID=3364338 RepID=UPI00378C8353
MQPLTPGDPPRIGPHRLLARLGAGGMGEVYLVRSPDGHLCALKVVKEDLAHDAQFRARFRREIRAARTVRGPFVPGIVDADPDAPAPWMATEYVPGPTLKEAVLRGGPFPEPSLRVLALGLARALCTVHDAGITHRDLKPSNVLLSPRGPQVIDFGIARAVEGTVLTRTGQTLGTPAYTSPEQITGEEVTPRSDVFSMAGTVVFAACGQPPFGAGRPSAVLNRVLDGDPFVDAVPAGPLRDVVAACLAKDPEDRPDAERVREALSALPLPSAEHGWLPSPVTRQIDVREGESRRADEAERTTVPLDGGAAASDPARTGPPPGAGADSLDGGAHRAWWRRRATAVAAAVCALAVVGAAALAAVGVPLPGQDPPPAADGGDPSDGPSGDPGAEPSDAVPSVNLDGFVYDLVFSDDGETLYVFGSGTLSAWDWREGVPVDVFEPAPYAAHVTSTGYVAAAADGYVEVWEGSSENRVAVVADDNGEYGAYDMPALTDDGSRLAVLVSEDGTPEGDRAIQIWDVAADTAEVEIPVEGVVADIRFTGDGSRLVATVATRDYATHLGVVVWDAATGRELHRISGDGQYAFALSPDGSALAVVDETNRARLVDTGTGATVRELAPVDEGHERIYDLSFSADGGRVLAGTYPWPDSRGSVWDTATGALLRDEDVFVYDPVAVHPDGEHIATPVSEAGGNTILILDSEFAVVSELS